MIYPWRQSGSIASLRDFANVAYNVHHGIQTAERFGLGTDPDGDGVRNEMTRGDVTAVTLFMATLPVPGRVIPRDPRAERRVLAGERLFDQVGCTVCHVRALPLARAVWTDPGTTPGVEVALTDTTLPLPRLAADAEALLAPAYTDFKLHDISDPSDSTWTEPLDLNQPVSSPRRLQGNRRFLTRRLWGAANEPPYFHHGLFTTLRDAIRAHAGEAAAQRAALDALTRAEQDAIVAFLETLQVLPPGSQASVVDEQYRPRAWPPPD